MAFASMIGVWRDGPLSDGVPTNTAVQLDWPRGLDGTIELRLIDQDRNRVELDLLGADRLEMAIRNSAGNGVLKSWLAVAASDEVGRYLFSIASADTTDLGGFMIFDVWATRAGSQRQVVAASYFNITMRMRAP